MRILPDNSSGPEVEFRLQAGFTVGLGYRLSRRHCLLNLKNDTPGVPDFRCQGRGVGFGFPFIHLSGNFDPIELPQQLQTCKCVDKKSALLPSDSPPPIAFHTGRSLPPAAPSAFAGPLMFPNAPSLLPYSMGYVSAASRPFLTGLPPPARSYRPIPPLKRGRPRRMPRSEPRGGARQECGNSAIAALSPNEFRWARGDEDREIRNLNALLIILPTVTVG